MSDGALSVRENIKQTIFFSSLENSRDPIFDSIFSSINRRIERLECRRKEGKSQIMIRTREVKFNQTVFFSFSYFPGVPVIE